MHADGFIGLMAKEALKKPPATQRKPLLSRTERYELAKAIADLTINFHFLLTPARIPARLR